MGNRRLIEDPGFIQEMFVDIQHNQFPKYPLQHQGGYGYGGPLPVCTIKPNWVVEGLLSHKFSELLQMIQEQLMTEECLLISYEVTE